MESIIVSVKENVGNEKTKVKIFSRDVIADSTIQIVKGMTLDEAKKYGKNNGWKVIDWEN